MKISKFLAVSALTLSLSGISFVNANAEQLDNTDSDNITYENQGIEIMPFTLAASYMDGVTTNGEYKNNFYVGSTASEYSTRYNFTNNGNNTFDYKIFRPDGSVFADGTLNPGESRTTTLEKNCYYMPRGTYKFSIITKNGGVGKFSFAFRVLD